MAAQLSVPYVGKQYVCAFAPTKEHARKIRNNIFLIIIK
jgi:hypothetical protein